MKKILIMLLSVLMMFTMVGCSKSEGGSSNGGSEPTVDEVKTPAAVLKADFETKAGEGEWTVEDLANEIVANEIIEFGPAVESVTEGYLNGFKEDVTGFEEGAFFGPMIGSIPFVGYIFKVSGDKEAFVKQLQDKHDLAWNICTQADEMATAVSGDYVFFVMAPSDFNE